MSYAVDCSCGKKLPVSAVDAGGAVLCSCGAILQVPALSVLRQQAGQSVYPVNVADKLLAMNQAGELPVEHSCIKCQIRTTDILDCWLVCETTYVKRTSIWETLAWMWLAPFAMIKSAHADDHAEQHG